MLLSPLLLAHFYLYPSPRFFPSHNPFISASSRLFFHPIAAWTWHQWLACGALGRNCPASTKSCSGTCRMSSIRPGTWPSTATSWAARACSLPSSHCSQWSRRISPSYMKVSRAQNVYSHVATFPFNCLLTKRLRPFLKLCVILYMAKSSTSSVLCERSISVRFTSAKGFLILPC